ncbi:nucleotidyltransferase domain-containing protein [Candidatus Woesearchaeota archaeon]|nr:nucleotidyltransferase domain-containing protein [Candidatus Woesearchaeota archaeon]
MGMADFLKTSKNSRRVFGRKEIEIMLKQLDGSLLTQSEKNRISRDIKPKLELVREMAKYESEFRLQKNQDSKLLIENALDTILKDELSDRIRAVLLFGSFSDKTYTSRSDIDICAVFRAISLKEATEFRIRVSGQLPEKADVQVFNILPQKIKREIARNHKVLYRAKDYDNVAFAIKYLKDQDYFIRMGKVFAQT